MKMVIKCKWINSPTKRYRMTKGVIKQDLIMLPISNSHVLDLRRHRLEVEE